VSFPKIQSGLRALVLRLASLLWRLRRATTMETGLFEVQANHLKDFRQARHLPASRDVTYTRFVTGPNDGLSGCTRVTASSGESHTFVAGLPN
jgi:hypothetical protein